MSTDQALINMRKERLLGQIAAHIAIEDFPTNYREAILKIVGYFNHNEESEKEIMKFAEYLENKYKF